MILYLVFYSLYFFFLMIRRPPRSTLDRSSAASDVYKRQCKGDQARGTLAAPAQRSREKAMQKRAYLAAIASAFAISVFAGPAMADAVSDGLAQAKANLAKYTSAPEFVAPGDAFDAKACARPSDT